mmetsp:Transcript_24998/g.50731  ORF Transcript_24998/g.50731 Transcript_24998/m.50731 type:complete len:157 (+) Transcript_24998:71-541(+)|eukprot:CAMPEP_0119056590 /NCGR_PEP_ID=MMETSP1178-20130426/1230_1 /TAXON_ID=33656 /ORGANISM="unid sp, Strain CCMP2000" /LENGTH=156 /DNA_ID=CAMNT_0007037331 /DNA_START=71 /DNA_END=541 /DNA_ORIENTATION=-
MDVLNRLAGISDEEEDDGDFCGGGGHSAPAGSSGAAAQMHLGNDITEVEVPKHERQEDGARSGYFNASTDAAAVPEDSCCSPEHDFQPPAEEAADGPESLSGDFSEDSFLQRAEKMFMDGRGTPAASGLPAATKLTTFESVGRRARGRPPPPVYIY